MNKEVAHELKEILLKDGGVPFVDVIAGMVQTITDKIEGENGIPITKRYPVSDDTNIADNCQFSPERILTPDSRKKGLIYFEDYGTRPINKSNSGTFYYKSKLRMVVWLNRARITGDRYSQITGAGVTYLLDKLKAGEYYGNIGFYQRFKVDVESIEPQESAIFNKYTYNEADLQYLRPPFEFFAINLSVEYGINKRCINQIEIKDKVCY